jgi:hypothetical protein
MAEKVFSYQGFIRIHLQGQNALEVSQITPGFLSCYLGSKLTNIRIRDFRRVSCDAAERVLQGKEPSDFADAFNQSALARIQSRCGKVQIDIYDGKANQHDPLLWLATINDDQELPLVQANWEIFRSAGESRTSFAALVNS